MTAAAALFNKSGLTASGVDTIVEQSGVAKMTFYNTYGSKEELIADYFARENKAALDLLSQFTSKPGLSPEQQLLAVFDALECWFSQPSFLGCPFINGYAETKGSPRSKPHKRVIRHFETLREFLLKMARRVNARKAEHIASTAMLLIAGAIVAQEALPDTKPLVHARRALQSILDDCSARAI